MQRIHSKLEEIAQKAIQNQLDSHEFDKLALELFQLHAQFNPIYSNWVDCLGINRLNVDSIQKIPFFPVRFFKEFEVGISNTINNSTLKFTSSTTTGGHPSKHFVHNPEIYFLSFLKAFELFYGHPSNWTILALLPGYLERTGSSLVYMAEHLISLSNNPKSGFYLNDFEALSLVLKANQEAKQNTLLLGVSFGLLDFIESKAFTNAELPKNPNLIVMETGGMKGRRIELTRMELHESLSNAFQVSKIHSEYGMTELLSQAYSKGDGIFNSPPWMKIMLRETDNPLASIVQMNRVGGVNIIDLANVYSCPFLAIDDLGKLKKENAFEVLGRFDQAEIRGCNLMLN
jgi:hypothetical protein